MIKRKLMQFARSVLRLAGWELGVQVDTLDLYDDNGSRRLEQVGEPYLTIKRRDADTRTPSVRGEPEAA